MSLIRDYMREFFGAAIVGWNRFWFSPADAATLGFIRILAGAMLFYTHLVWTIGLNAFFGPRSWISPEAAQQALARGVDRSYVWSYFWLIDSPTALWTAHLAALLVFAMLTLGLASRIVSVLAYLAAVSYVNRVPGALFGLDQINCMLAMYLMIGPSGDAFSLDRWLASRRAGHSLPPAAPSVSGNLAIRLMQVHMCVIYFFAGLGKLHGESWWYGDALWGAVANLEYQSIDVTWLADWPLTVAVMTQATVYWELFFCVLVWPRILRPLTLALAIPLHLGIAFFMGMITFGLAMLIGCASFIPPWLIRRLLGGAGIGAGQGSVEQIPGGPASGPRRSAASRSASAK